jgi:hypothetical protein
MRLARQSLQALLGRPVLTMATVPRATPVSYPGKVNLIPFFDGDTLVILADVT